MSNKKLYIIGNGFDLYHWQDTKPNTSYACFGDFLQKECSDIFDWLHKTLALPYETSTEEWSRFEELLGEFDGEEILDHAREYMDDLDPHRSGEASWEAERIVGDLTAGLRGSLKKHILALPYPDDISSIMLPIDKGALFLNFNYTNTLERYYGVHPDHICHIHGKADTDEELQIGHGVRPQESESETASTSPPAGFTPEQEEMWRDEMADRESLSYDLTVQEIEQYWVDSFKGAEQNIERNQGFFSLCRALKEVIVMGHSLAEVDMPYFMEVMEQLSPDAFWNISYHKLKEKPAMERALLDIGVPETNIHFFTLGELVSSNN